MASKFAKDQPSGFVNRIERVARVGGGGRLGSWIARELLKTGKHTVTAITRAESTNQLPDGIVAAKVDYNDEASIFEVLRGQQILIITINVFASPDTQAKLLEAASKAEVPYVIPNAWGVDPLDEKLSKDLGSGGRFPAVIEQCKSLGNITWIAMACGFWYEFSLGGTADRYGFDFKERAVTFFNDGTTKVNTSTFAQCGRAIAAFLSLPLLSQDKNDKRPVISHWDNDVFRISSFLVSQKDMFESVKRVTSTTDADWRISYEDSAERYKSGVEAMKNGDMRGLARFMYTRLFFLNSGGDFGKLKGLQNDVLGLPEEDLDEATKEAVRRGLEGIW
ncbi:unnamed protein product [Discula destructiva]